MNTMEINNKIIIGILVLIIIIIVAGCSDKTENINELDAVNNKSQENFETNAITGNVVNNGEQNTDLEDVAAIVNDQEIKISDVEMMKEAYSQQGQKITDEQALGQAINQKLLIQQSQKQKYATTDEEAEDTIITQLAQQGINISYYKTQLMLQGVSYEDLVEDVKKQISMQKFLDDALGSDYLNVTENEKRDLYERFKLQSPEDAPSFEDLEPQITATIQQQKKQESLTKLFKELVSEADIEYK